MTNSSKRPNFLVLMSDEHGPMFSGTYGHPLVKTPSMDRIAERGATFENGYCNAPLCTPSRLSFMTGKYVSHCQGWDNATPLDVGRVTWPWLLKSLGIRHGAERQDAHDGTKAPERLRRSAQPRPARGKRSTLCSAGRTASARAVAPWPDVLDAGPGRSEVIDHDEAVESAAHDYLQDPVTTGKALGDGLRLHIAALSTQRARALLLHVLPRQRGPAGQSARPPGLAAPGGGATTAIHGHWRSLHRRPAAEGAGGVLRHDHVSRREVRAHPRHAREDRPGGATP